MKRVAVVGALLGVARCIAVSPPNVVVDSANIPAAPSIDRQTVVSRHNVFVQSPNISITDVLQLGNGAFAFNVDVTGLQSLNSSYADVFDLNTMADFQMHTVPWSPDPRGALSSYNFTWFNVTVDGNGSTRPVPYFWDSTYYHNVSGSVTGWMMSNPHRLNLGQTSLRMFLSSSASSQALQLSQITAAQQVLDLWQGQVSSNFTINSTLTAPPVNLCGWAPADGGHVVTVSCGPPSSGQPQQQVITSVPFVEYANVSGDCTGGFEVHPPCVSPAQVRPIVEAMCLNKTFCSVPAASSLFSDPCSGKYKALALNITCGLPPQPLPAVPSFNVSVTTAVHPDMDLVATVVTFRTLPSATTSSATAAEAQAAVTGALGIRLAFPYGSQNWGPGSSDWNSDAAHLTTIVNSSSSSVSLLRQLDYDGYRVDCAWSDSSWTFVQLGRNTFELQPPAAAVQQGAGTVEFSCLYTPWELRYPVGSNLPWLQQKAAASAAAMSNLPSSLPSAAETLAAAAQGWASYWNTGAFVDLASNTQDPRASELERRVILSQYVLRVQEAGAEPPQETGLISNSWSGKHHLEMRFWHHAHFGLWNRVDLLQRSDGFYHDLLPNVTSYAQFQGYKGARWLKETGTPSNRSLAAVDVQWPGSDYLQFPFNNGNSAGYGSMLTWEAAQVQNAAVIWQQPHPVFLAELERQVINATQGTAAALAFMNSMTDIVFATADFLSSYPFYNATDGSYMMGPPMYGAEEMGNGITMRNPSFELVYYAWALDVANEWRLILGLTPDTTWDAVARQMHPPVVDVGADPSYPTYSFNEDCACVFQQGTASCPPDRFNKTQCDGPTSHPSIIAFYGMVNGLAGATQPGGLSRYGVNATIANNTLAYVLQKWQFGSPTDGANIWGWDLPLLALSQARLQWSPSAIVDVLLMDVLKNSYLNNGCNYQSGSLPAYFPGNGGLLLAVGMLAAGSAQSPALYFPPEWRATAEGFAVPYI